MKKLLLILFITVNVYGQGVYLKHHESFSGGVYDTTMWTIRYPTTGYNWKFNVNGYMYMDSTNTGAYVSYHDNFFSTKDSVAGSEQTVGVRVNIHDVAHTPSPGLAIEEDLSNFQDLYFWGAGASFESQKAGAWEKVDVPNNLYYVALYMNPSDTLDGTGTPPYVTTVLTTEYILDYQRGDDSTRIYYKHDGVWWRACAYDPAGSDVYSMYYPYAWYIDHRDYPLLTGTYYRYQNTGTYTNDWRIEDLYLPGSVLKIREPQNGKRYRATHSIAHYDWYDMLFRYNLEGLTDIADSSKIPDSMIVQLKLDSYGNWNGDNPAWLRDWMTDTISTEYCTKESYGYQGNYYWGGYSDSAAYLNRWNYSTVFRLPSRDPYRQDIMRGWGWLKVWDFNDQDNKDSIRVYVDFPNRRYLNILDVYPTQLEGSYGNNDTLWVLTESTNIDSLKYFTSTAIDTVSANTCGDVGVNPDTCDGWTNQSVWNSGWAYERKTWHVSAIRINDVKYRDRSLNIWMDTCLVAWVLEDDFPATSLWIKVQDAIDTSSPGHRDVSYLRNKHGNLSPCYNSTVCQNAEGQQPVDSPLLSIIYYDEGCGWAPCRDSQSGMDYSFSYDVIDTTMIIDTVSAGVYDTTYTYKWLGFENGFNDDVKTMSVWTTLSGYSSPSTCVDPLGSGTTSFHCDQYYNPFFRSYIPMYSYGFSGSSDSVLVSTVDTMFAKIDTPIKYHLTEGSADTVITINKWHNYLKEPGMPYENKVEGSDSASAFWHNGYGYAFHHDSLVAYYVWYDTLSSKDKLDSVFVNDMTELFHPSSPYAKPQMTHPITFQAYDITYHEMLRKYGAGMPYYIGYVDTISNETEGAPCDSNGSECYDYTWYYKTDTTDSSFTGSDTLQYTPYAYIENQEELDLPRIFITSSKVGIYEFKSLPPNVTYVYDIWANPVGIQTKRNYFRGIHPKMRKD